MVGTGLSFPYVALYNNDGGTITYANGMKLGRGVEMSYEAETSDSNIFYADNREAEIVGGRFLSGTLTAEIDGLETAAKKLVYGLGDASRTVTVGQETVELLGMQGAEPPFVGVGYIERTQMEGVVGYYPVILPKVKFAISGRTAHTQEEDIDWQTQTLEGTFYRDDTATADWLLTSETPYATEAEAEAVIKAFLNVA